ncbi:hypothetical protein [Chryseobacterium wanjuense]|uniref:hypothetical protein n=1 Tax=Chryseobacterium wanjuense TaxID=356305 RepID=UPI00147AC103|nr:hypothetical protein [Chryseobacterium wanjuense]
MIQKIYGTELFSLLKNSIQNSSQRIAELLDNSLSSQTNTSSSVMQKDEVNDFDINEFI